MFCVSITLGALHIFTGVLLDLGPRDTSLIPRFRLAAYIQLCWPEGRCHG